MDELDDNSPAGGLHLGPNSLSAQDIAVLVALLKPYIAANGVQSVTGATGITVNQATGNVTITNAGVTSIVAGTGITIDHATGAVTITNGGVTSIVAGTGISISGATGAVTISASGGGLSSVTGTDSITGVSVTAPGGYSHTTTITHGLGKPPVIVTVSCGDLLTPVPSGSSTNYETQSVWMYLNHAGVAIGGMYMQHHLTAGGGGTRVLDAAGFNPTSISSTGATSGGTGSASITVNNFTSTTFDIVYAANLSTGTYPSFDFPTVTWYAMG